MSLPNISVDNTELNDFFNFLYHNTDGFVYVALKDPKLDSKHPDYWKKKFFHWPYERKALINYVATSCGEFDVYTSPGLFRTEEANKGSWLGTHVLWTEFDGNTPDPNGSKRLDYPNPTLRIRSSDETHEHWYWKLSEFVTSTEIFEGYARRVSYGLEADTSTWNCNRVLRPPSTIHHESSNRTSIVYQGDNVYSLNDFEVFPELPQRVENVTELRNVPEILDVIRKYQWSDAVFQKFRNKELPGKRSDSLCWLAHKCAEMGMADNEIMSVLLNTDSRWEKFTGRTDRIEQLSAIISNTRQKHPQNELPTVGIWDFVQQDIQLNWIINNFLPDQSITTMVSPPGAGKTQFALQLAIHVALGYNFIGMQINEPMSSTFASLEMPEAQLHYFASHMIGKYSDKEKQILNEKLKLIPLGRRLSLNKKAPQEALARHVNKYKSHGVIIDSFGRAIDSSTNDEQAANDILEYLKSNFVVSNNFVWAIHHFRKSQVGNKKPEELDDLKGAGAFGELSDLVLSLTSRGTDELIVKSLKSKLSRPIKEFTIRRTPDLNFERSGASNIDTTKIGNNDNKQSDSSKTSLSDTI